jgi:hypothetical protein
VVPVLTFPKATLVGVIAATGATATPVPLNETLTGDALLATAMDPVADPEAVGLKETVPAADWPAASVAGRVNPATLNPAPDAVTEEIVTLTVPLFVSVSALVAVLPTLILPNDIEVGEEDNTGATPVPLTAIANGEVAPSFAILNPPETAPAAVGAKRTVTLTLAPTATVAGIVRPVVVNEADVPVIAEIMTGLAPVLVRVSGCVCAVPTATLPKANAAGEADSWPGVIPVPESATLEEPLVASLVNVIVPVELPLAFGA